MVRIYINIIFLLGFITANFSFAQTTYIQDSAFEQALIDLGIDSDGIINGSVATADIEAITSLDISNRNIQLIAGIEDFINLQELYCQNNDIIDVYVSQNNKLKILNCSGEDPYYHAIVRLYLPQNGELEYLNCSNNPNGVEGLNTGLMSKLKTLICSNSGLTSLNVSNVNTLEYLNCSMNYYWDGSTGDIIPLTNLILGDNPNLTTVSCSQNNISVLDLTGLPNLTSLNCSSNNLTNFNITQNSKLEILICNNNNIKSLNFQNFPNLSTLRCDSNQLTLLNIKNSNNPNLMIFDAHNNPFLTCIEVDDADAVNSGIPPYDSWLKDDTAIYLEDCENATFIPDPNFELALIYAGIDSDETVNGIVATSDIINVTTLDLPILFDIEDLTGIEDFINLTNLYCRENKITSLNLSQNTYLETLNCSINKISNLNIGQNENLTNMDCEGNLLTDLDISGATMLSYLNCGSNRLYNLNIGYNTHLTRLECYSNSLSTLDITNCPSLNILFCGGNQLTSLDISQNPNFQGLICEDNQLLTDLNVKNGHNSSLYVYAINNPSLACIQVDDEDAANAGLSPYGDWYVDDHVVFSENCTALGIEEEMLRTSISIYPNPVAQNLTIETQTPITKIVIYSMLGKKVREIYTDFSPLNISYLSSGIYLAKIYSENKITTKKFIKN